MIIFFTLLPSLAFAGNLNLPTILFTERLMLYSFVLIVSLEAFVIYRSLPKIGKKAVSFLSLKANLLTMLLVVPTVWGILALARFNMPEVIKIFVEGNILAAIFISSWIADTLSILLAEWIMAPVYFIASYYAEYWFSRKKLKDYDKKTVKKAFFFANLYSYLMIMTFETIYQLVIGHLKMINPEFRHLW